MKSVDGTVPVRRSGGRVELGLRVVATPEAAAAQLLAHLGLRVPLSSRRVGNVVPKVAPKWRKTMLRNVRIPRTDELGSRLALAMASEAKPTAASVLEIRILIPISAH